MNNVEILIISNKLDFTTDYVCWELKNRNANYLRVNRDEFDKYNIILNVLDSESLMLETDNRVYYCGKENLKAIYYRAPIYLRDIYQPYLSEEQQLYRTQWAAFVRNLTVFEDVFWMNNPISTFKAENKLLQLKYAQKIGFLCPCTVIANNGLVEGIKDEKDYIVKSLDTAVLRIEDKEAFVYSNVVKGREIKAASLNISPVVIQDYIYPKTDIRVTVVGNTIFGVKIVKDNRGVEGDWRKMKDDLDFIPIHMPDDINEKCIQLVKMLGLTFGAIDLIESNGQFYFIEINPTGEWAWLVNTANLKPFIPICDHLEGKDYDI